MISYAFKVRKEDLDLLKEYADSVGTTPAQIIRESIRVYLARAGMLNQEDADRILQRWGMIFEGTE